MMLRTVLYAVLLVLAVHPACFAGSLLGAWRLDDGRIFTLAPSADATWRYRFVDNGASGRLYPEADTWVGGDGFATKTPVALTVERAGPDILRWRRLGGAMQSAQRVPLAQYNIPVESGGVQLHVSLVLPANAGPHPVVVLVHGSEKSAAVGVWHDPYYLAAYGIGAVVYDKRGTGRSGGAFSANFHVLANDAAAVAAAVATRADVDGKRIGFAGYSQGGWVAPLAAHKFGSARAVLVGYGSVHSPLHEDRFQCLSDVEAGGGDATALREASLLVDAAHALLRSNLRDGWDAFEVRARQYARRPWFRQLDGQRCIAAGFAAYPAWIVRLFAPSRLPPGIDWDYDSAPLLARMDVPMLWLLAGQDREAPAADSAAALLHLRDQGKPYAVELFPAADHGMLRYRVQDGKRVPSGYEPDYLRRSIAFWTSQFGAPSVSH